MQSLFILKKRSLTAVAIVFCMVAFTGAASAITFTLDAVNRGWFDQNSDANGGSAGNNYIAGNCGLNDCSDGEFRNWFQFAIPALAGPIASCPTRSGFGQFRL